MGGVVVAKYRCLKCGHAFREVWSKDKMYPKDSADELGVPMSTPGHPPCPKCGSSYYKRIMKKRKKRK